jgi:protein-disulfide isomerase
MTVPKLASPVTPADHVLGGESARVTLVEYGDFECPYCAEAYPVLQRVRGRLGDGLRFVFRSFPLFEIHPHAHRAAEAAESVAARGGPAAFWAMHDLLFENQRRLDDASLGGYAGRSGVDPQTVLRDLREGRYRQAVRDSFTSGVESGVNGTPTLFIDGIRYDGPRDEQALVSALELITWEGR